MSQNNLIYIIAISLVLLIILLIIRSLRKKRTKCEILNINIESDLDKMIKIRKELEKLHDDIILTINSGISDIESRIKELRDLLMVSDEKILFLNSLMDETHGKLHSLESRLSKLDRSLLDNVEKPFEIDTEIAKIEISSVGRRKML